MLLHRKVEVQKNKAPVGETVEHYGKLNANVGDDIGR